MKFINSLMLLLAVIPALFFEPKISQQQNIIVEQTVSADYPLSITFSITLNSSPKKIKSAYLFVQPVEEIVLGGETFTDILPVQKGENVKFLKTIYPGSIPRWLTYNELPFAPHEYYWIIYFADGSHFQTSTERIYFEDHKKYPWQSKQEGNLLFRWYGDDTKSAQELFDQAQEAYDEINNIYPLQPPFPIQVIIFQKPEDLTVWNSHDSNFIGVSMLRANTLVVIASEMQGRQTFLHEMTHFGLFYLVGDKAFAAIPPWINEGLAVYHEKDDQILKLVASNMRKKMAARQVLSLSQMDTTLEWQTHKGPYDEAYSAVLYLVETYGEEKIKAILPQFHHYGTPDLTFKQEWGISYADLNSNWQKWVKDNGMQPALTPTAVPTKVTAVPTLSPLSTTQGQMPTPLPMSATKGRALTKLQVIGLTIPIGIFIFLVFGMLKRRKHKV